MGMYHSTSGKCGYAGYSLPCSVKLTKSQIRALLTREEELRQHGETQAAYSADDTCEHIRDVTVALQKRAIAETLPSGLVRDTGMETLLVAMHNLRFDPTVAQDPELNAITVYQRMDLSHPGSVKNGCKLPDATLVTVSDGTTVSLHDLVGMESKTPTVIVAGSAS